MKDDRFTFAPIPALIGLSVAALVAWAISYFSGIGFWLAFGIAVAAMLINGFIATVEDNAPGGFNNPEPGDDAKAQPAIAYIKRFVGFIIFVVGTALAGWIVYSLFIERLPAAQGRNPIPAIALSVGSLFVGYKWMRGPQA